MKRFVLLTAAGVLYFLGLVGFDIWPLSLVAFVPALWALDVRHEPPLSRSKLLACGLWMGTVTMAGGYYWLVGTLEVYSGFPWLLCVLLSTLVWIYQGGSIAISLWLASRALGRGYNAALALVPAVVASELLFPQLFGWYLGNALHNQPLAIQVADLGGALLVSALIALTNGTIYEVLRAGVTKQPRPRALLIVTGSAWALTLAYGAYRIDEVDARAAAADKLRVGLIQTNMGIFAKRRDIETGLKRHIEQSVELEEEHELDLLVWPESAFGYYIPERMRNVRGLVLGSVRTPTLFGGLSRRNRLNRVFRYNTAFLASGEGDILGTYDKTYLLAFGEYIPFGEAYPELYQYSPNTGHFTPGDHMRPLELEGHRLAVLICYEDILPGFVRQFVSSSAPHLLINITNDAWFGDTLEPWQHLALAKFRSVEHHRAMVRATNSGVSAAIDPVGRVITQSGVYERASLTATVPMLESQTVYNYAGDWPGWLGLLAILWLAFGPKRAAQREA